MKKISKVSFLLLILIPLLGRAQNLPVGSPALEDYYRNLQLLGNIDSSVSFMIKPLTSKVLNRDIFKPQNDGSEARGSSDSTSRSFDFRLLPVLWAQQFNSAHPYGWNDGSMIPARGLQSKLTAGIYMRFKFLSIQLQPEFIFAENKRYKGFLDADHSSTIVKAYYDNYINRIDAPERFGNSGYTKLFSGQSSIRLTFGPVSGGISTENLWWGPGKRNSLLMSNTAPGFRHITINTVKPVRTWLGSFEGQMIGARLNDSGFEPLQGVTDNISQYAIPKRNDWRYLAGTVFSFQPKWVPGLFLGFTRVFNSYNSDMHGFTDYVPVFSALEKKKAGEAIQDAKSQDQYSSLFLRWAFPKSNAEFYFEYGRNDHPYNLRDIELEPEHSRAYIVGFQKLFKLAKTGDFIQASIEGTQVENSKTIFIRVSPSWYVHHLVTQGYTNEGQIVGAGIGTGSDLQSFELSWNRGLKKLGMQLERYVHNNDFQYAAFSDLRRPWVDLAIAANGNWNYKDFMISGTFKYIRSLNYEWERNIQDSPDTNIWWLPGIGSQNLHINLGIYYSF